MPNLTFVCRKYVYYLIGYSIIKFTLSTCAFPASIIHQNLKLAVSNMTRDAVGTLITATMSRYEENFNILPQIIFRTLFYDTAYRQFWSKSKIKFNQMFFFSFFFSYFLIIMKIFPFEQIYEILITNAI